MRPFVRFLFFFTIAAAVVAPPATAQSRIACSVLHSRILKQSMHYCVYLPAGYDEGTAQHSSHRYPVLYFLHGLGDNEQSLFNSGGWTLIDDLRRQHKLGDFLIAAPEGRRSFYINSADGKFRYSDFFLQEFIPEIEKKYRTLTTRNGRGIAGISMGGYGALRFAFAHPELFSAVSAQSAALITETPKQLDAAEQAGTDLGRLLGGPFGAPINQAHWDQNNPVVLTKKNAAGLGRVAIYFNCGQKDNYGFETGSAQLHEALAKEGIKHEYHSYPGDHSFGYFMSHFDEVMEFHSRAFALTP